MYCSHCDGAVVARATDCAHCGADLRSPGSVRFTTAQERGESLADLFPAPPAVQAATPTAPVASAAGTVASAEQPHREHHHLFDHAEDASPDEAFDEMLPPDHGEGPAHRSMPLLIGLAVLLALAVVWGAWALSQRSPQRLSATPGRTPTPTAADRTAWEPRKGDANGKAALVPAYTPSAGRGRLHEAKPTPRRTRTPSPTPWATPSSRTATTSSQKVEAIPVPREARSCASDVAAAGTTSCGFAQAVANKIPSNRSGNFQVVAKSPVTGRTYTMVCTGGRPVVCRGAKSAVVYVGR